MEKLLDNVDKVRLKFLLGLLVVCVLLSFNNCGHTGGKSQYLPTIQIESNAAPLNIIGNEAYILSVSTGCGYVNEPCVTVQVCQPGTSNCVNISNILLDTGSYGLRVFSSLVSSLHLTQETDGLGNPLAECQSYADGSADWGPIARADVLMNGETASNIPIQLIDAGFGSPPSDCEDLDRNPSETGFNGILGVGHFIYDCGNGCVVGSNNRIYFNCPGGTSDCSSSIAVALRHQVMNPAAALPVDNNGVVVQMPAISPYGATGVNGWLVFGIGTQANNTPPSGVVTFPADTNSGNFETNFNSINYSAFIDSGSNGLYFPTPSGLTVCDSPISGFYCPSSAYISSATQEGAAGTPSQSIQFEIQDADIALSTTNPNIAFNNLGGPFSGQFDWGFPFFLGRTIYVGFEGVSSSLGKGPYWAY